jgi:hypothetical protein
MSQRTHMSGSLRRVKKNQGQRMDYILALLFHNISHCPWLDPGLS